MKAHELWLRRSRKKRQNVTSFTSLVSSPPSGQITAPANARFSVESTAVAGDGATALTVVGPSTRTIKVPAMAIGDMRGAGYVEEGSVVTIAAGFDLYIDSGLGVLVKVGQGAI